MATITSAASGNWADGSTWVGGVAPQTGVDIAVIGAHTVTIPAGTSVEIGDGSSTNAINLNNASARLIVNGNLTLVGNLNQATAGSRVEFTVTTNAITVTLKNSATLVSKWTINGLTTCRSTITGTASNRVSFVVNTTAGGAAGYIDYSGFNPIIAWSYATFTGLGTTGQKSVNSTLSQQVTLSDCSFVSSGEVCFTGGSASGTQSFTRVVVINGLNTSGLMWTIGNTAAITGGTRLVDTCGIYTTDYSSTNKYLNLDARDVTFQNCVFSHAHVQLAGGRVNTLFQNCTWVGRSAGSSSRRYRGQSKNNTRIEDCIFIAYTTDANKNPHFIDESTAGGTAAGTQVSDCVVDGCNNGDTGDFFMPIAEHQIRRVLLVGSGNLTDGLYNGSTAADVENCTLVRSNNADSSNTQSAIIASEAFPTASKIVNTRNCIFYENQSGISMGGGSWTEQSAWVLDYNCWWNITDLPDLYVHPTLGSSYLRRGTVTRVTGTTTSVSGNDVTIPDASSVIVGDVYGGPSSQFAVITAVNGNVVTLGQRFNATPGTLGMTGLAGSQAFSIYKNYWTAGLHYGETNRGLNDFKANPSFADPTRNALTWDVLNGGSGSNIDNVTEQMFKVTGFDIAGAPATFGGVYTHDSYKTYMRTGYTPTNDALRTAGYDGGYVGAIEMQAPVVSSRRRVMRGLLF